MKLRRNTQCMRRACNFLSLYLLVGALCLTHCDARRSPRRLTEKAPSSLFLITAAKLNLVKYLNSDTTNGGSYGVSSPFTLPPYESLAPNPLPQNAPPYCIYPPNTPQAPSTPVGQTPNSPFSYLPPASPSEPIFSPPAFVLNPPPASSSGPFLSPPDFAVSNPPPASPLGPVLPSPSEPSLSPPYFAVPNPTPASPSEPSLSPPDFAVPNPPPASPSGQFVPSPFLSPPVFAAPNPPDFGSVPEGPPVFLPPIVYPPPKGPPHHGASPSMALWCVAKPTVPDPIIQEAMNYACGSGADCDSIQPNGSCFKPDTLIAHASFAFNSYWQRTKVAGGTCEFGGTAMLVTADPSSDGCHFVYY